MVSTFRPLKCFMANVRLFLQFRSVVLHIFLQKRNTMLEDALQIAETFDSKLCIEVYKLWIQQLIENE